MNKTFLEAANRAEPELMQKTAQALALIEKMTPELLPDVLEEFETISDITTEKLAAAPEASSARVLRDFAGKAAIGVAASLGSAIAADVFDVAKRGLFKSRDLKRILTHNPKLREEVNDPSRLKPAFNALYRYAPDLMSDPMVGGSLLKALANQAPGNEHVMVTGLLGSRKNLVDIKSNQFRLDLRDALKKDKDGGGPIHYHQHFEGKGPKKKPLALANPGATPTND